MFGTKYPGLLYIMYVSYFFIYLSFNCTDKYDLYAEDTFVTVQEP
jgi:hypothetical protein